uniref:Putative secreted protein n=1 Tax=Ixodes scapularis TaxID=6945 RepID=A0A4D5RXB4_IXOSC
MLSMPATHSYHWLLPIATVSLLTAHSQRPDSSHEETFICSQPPKCKADLAAACCLCAGVLYEHLRTY